MTDAVHERHGRWRLGDLLREYPNLRIVPSIGNELVLAGKLAFHVSGPDGLAIADEYSVEVLVPPNFPRSLALVRETDGRIPKRHHKLEDDFLCLGTPTEQRLVLARCPTLPHFVSRLVVPYLYGYSYYAEHGTLPYGEEQHGDQGIRDQLGRLFHAPAISGVEEFLRLTSLKKRSANKLLCPCQSGRRLGRCHNRVVNRHRKNLGTKWFREEYVSVCALLGKRRSSSRSRQSKPPTLRETLESTNNSVPSPHPSLEKLGEVASVIGRTIGGSAERPALS